MLKATEVRIDAQSLFKNDVAFHYPTLQTVIPGQTGQQLRWQISSLTLRNLCEQVTVCRSAAVADSEYERKSWEVLMVGRARFPSGINE